jgi:glycosyltransferase involved in cell wall biosynthesis
MTFMPVHHTIGQLSWLNVTSHLDPRFGGIAKMLPEYCAAVSTGAGGCQASILGFCDDAERVSQDIAMAAETVLPGKLAWLAGARPRLLSKKIAQFDGVHIHGLWEEHTFSAVRAARAAGKPYIISAHGMLEPWALRNKRLKKLIYSWLTERDNVQGAACLHALTAAEAKDYRRYGAKAPIALIPNGVRVAEGADSEPFFQAFPALRGPRLVLFLGRVHPKKGLDLLVRAWKSAIPAGCDTHLVIAGPDVEKTQMSIEREIQELGIGASVTFTGMLRGSLKWSALAACDLFVLPSYSEGLSVSVLEALGMGKPVLVTEACNIPEVSEYNCGWVTSPDVVPVAAALQDFLGTSGEATREMGQRGRSLVNERFDWKKIGAQTTEVYRWVAGGPKPATVRMVWE